MRILWPVLICFLMSGPAYPADMETVIVEPRTHTATRNETDSREEQIRSLQADAQANQQGILEYLEPMTVARVGRNAPVAEVHSLWLVNRVVVTARPVVVAALRSRPDVTAVRATSRVDLVAPVLEHGTAPTGGKTTYGLGKIRAAEAWAALSINGAGVAVGHLDTGVQASHPDIKGKILLFKDFFGSDSQESFDGMGHGTHTAGTIAGGSASGTAIGVAPGAQLIVGRIFNNSGSTTDAIILRAMNWIADPDGNPSTNDAPRLVSNSWGGPKSTETPGGDLWNAVQHWVDLGIYPVFAAGNSGPTGSVGEPGAYPHSLAVGSTNWFNWLSFFSSRGPSRWDGTDYIKPDVCAPGSSVYSAKDGGGWTSMSGTSMACPHTAGAVALMLQANPNLTLAQITQVLKSTAKDLGSDGPDNKYGWGLVDCVKAVEKARALARFEQATGR